MPKKRLFRCYIDESGDEGFKFDRGSRPWFFLTGVIVEDKDEPLVRGTVDRIVKKIWLDRNQSPPAMLHWKDISHNAKIVVATELSNQPFCFISVGIWKPKLQPTSFMRKSDPLFRYASRMLLERASWYVNDNEGEAEIIFSSRNRLLLVELQTYISRVIGMTSQIRPVFDPLKIRVRTPDKVKMLQIADACASATGAAFNPDIYGNLQPFYLEILKGRLYRREGRLLSYVLKLFPDDNLQTEYPFVEGL